MAKPRIKGKFAPLTEELGWDDRFKLQLTDFERLMYLLIIHTTHMTHHRAPENPQYYKLQYGLNARKGQIENAIKTLKGVFPKLRTSDGKLSLINSSTYESQNRLEIEVETEEEIETEGKRLVRKWFEEIWSKYPNRVGKKQAQRHYEATVKSEKDRFDCQDALVKYQKHLEENTWKKPQNGSTWFNNWRDWFDWVEPVNVESKADKLERSLKT